MSLFITGAVRLVVLSPTPFFGSATVYPGHGGCDISSLVNDPNAIQCINQSLFFDSDYGPQTFDLNVHRSLSRFVGWTTESYMMFDMGAVTMISAIDISVVNVPRGRVGLPNFRIYRTTILNLIDVSPTDTRAVRVPYDFLQNEHLSINDSAVRNITLRPRTTIRTRYLLLRWTFAGLALQGFAISEIRFCGDQQPRNTPQPIQFQSPTDFMTTILPSARDFVRNRFVSLVCTVSNSGSFTWQWTKNGQPVPQAKNIEVVSADGTRTTNLTIFNPSSRDVNAIYTCSVSNALRPNINAARHLVALPCKLQ